MNRKNMILNIAENNNGVVLTSQVKELGISTKFLTELVREEKIYKIQRGIYVTSDGYVNDYFLIQHKYSKGVFSHETALFIHGFSDCVPNKFIMTFKQGFSTSNINKNEIKCVTISKGIDIGVEEVNISGLSIKVYNIERNMIKAVNIITPLPPPKKKKRQKGAHVGKK